MTGPSRAAIYARVSTRKQSLAMQLDALREFAARRGLVGVREFVDEGVSGKKDSRPELDKMMDLCRKRQIDVVLVYKFDRFSRSLKHLVNALDDFDTLGIDFVSYSENIDTKTSMGRAMFSVIGALAEFERDTINERVNEGLARAKARGTRLGRPATVIKDVQAVQQLRDAGASVRDIARKTGIGRKVLSRVLARKPIEKTSSPILVGSGLNSAKNSDHEWAPHISSPLVTEVKA